MRIREIISLASLAPDLTEAILNGTETAYMSLSERLVDIPADWAKQREIGTAI